MLKNIILALALLLSLFFVTACGEGSVEEKLEQAEKKVDEVTDDAAEAISKKIKTPIQKAKEMAHKGDERLEEIGQAIKGD